MVKAGYKQTEVGIIPEDWKLESLGDICTKIQDGNYGGDYPKAYEFISHGVPFLTSKTIGKDGYLQEKKIDFISQEKHAQLKKAHIKLNDVLFTNRGASVGAIGFVDKRIDGGNIGPQLTLLRADEQIISSDYLFQVMKSAIVQKQISSQDSGSAMNFFGIKDTKKFLLVIPTNKNEQRVIAEALSDVDGLIAGLDQLIAKKRDVKTAVMQQLLTGEKRLMGKNGRGYKQTELGLIPEDWDIKSYEEIFDFLSTATNSRKDLSVNDDVFYIHYGDIHTKWEQKLDFKKSAIPTIVQSKVKGASYLRNGDLVMADASEDYEGIGKSVEVMNRLH